ncbi:MAG: ADP-forming succinate--CoA ligase subunit beta [Rickettsia sp.]|nr:ADP-forming succinate--CoA ligase subunit beta [Rickettsia sp.]
MNIHEYQAKNLFAKYGIKILQGSIILQESEIEDVIENFSADKYVVKAQVHSGSRGKGGGIKITDSKKQACDFAKDMYGKFLVTPQTTQQGLPIKRIYIEEGFNISQQYYLSILVDKKSSMIIFIASSSGGVDIEEVAINDPSKIKKLHICPFFGLHNFQIVKFANELGIKSYKSLRSFTKVANAMYKMFLDLDATQIEINPLSLDDQEEFIALDAKMDFDDNALFKHPEIRNLLDTEQYDASEIRASSSGLSYIKMEGDIGCMVNGAGLAMATMDIIKFYGGNPANFLDVGGGADVVKVTEAFRIISADDSVKAILVNIFGGIMKCNIIAEGIITAVKEVGLKIPLIVRLAGTNFELGKKILDSSNIKLQAIDDLSEAAREVVKASKNSQ